MPRTIGRLAPLALLALLFPTSPLARACNVPVFRYALERWPADPYEVVVFYRGPLAPADKAITEALAKHADREPSLVNFTLDLVDLVKKPEPHRLKLYESLASKELPQLVVRYPDTARLKETVWSGPLSVAAVNALLDSPVRREVVRRIVSGDSGVWILLEGGDAGKDEAAAKLMQSELANLQKNLKLPQLTDDPEDKLSGKGPPLKLAFSMVRLSRTDPAEQMLVRMLLGLEDDLRKPKYQRAPMAFGVFGRGRAMLPLIGAGITADNLRDDARFVIGPCTCKVKEQNPGVDLLFAADWTAPADKQPAMMISIEAPPAAPPPPAAEEAGGSPLLLRNLLLAAAGGLVLVGAIAFLAMRKSNGGLRA